MKRAVSILAVLLLCFSTYSQVDSKTKQECEEVEIYFDQDSYAINLDLRRNREQFETLKDLIYRLQADTLTTITKIEISSYTSPEGGRSYNNKLSVNRANSIYDYLSSAISIPDSIITKLHTGTDWDGLYSAVQASDMAYKEEVLHIIKNVPEETWGKADPTAQWISLLDSRLKHLMDINYGRSYKWMYTNIFPQLRRGSVVTIYYRIIVPRIAEEPIKPKVDVVLVEPEVEEPIVVEIPIVESTQTTIEEAKPLLAIKTNLLYDAVSAINIELELPIGERWSIAGEWIFPWWSSGWEESSNRNCFQLLNGNLEGKYWFGDRTDRPVLTGWHVGLYAGGGLYDLERNKQGYQGEFFIASGLSGGYAHTINKSGSLRMEYSVAVGYLKTNYDRYAEHWGIDNSWHTIRQESGNYTWIGPTRAKVSLVWMLNRKVNRGK